MIASSRSNASRFASKSSYRSGNQSRRNLLLKNSKSKNEEFLEGGEQEINANLPKLKKALTFVKENETDVTLESIHNLG